MCLKIGGVGGIGVKGERTAPRSLEVVTLRNLRWLGHWHIEVERDEQRYTVIYSELELELRLMMYIKSSR